MKKLLTLIAVMAFTVTVQAQHEQGDFTIQPRVGITISKFTDADKSKVNFAYGVEFEHFFADQFSWAAGLLFTNQGGKYTDIYDETNKKNDLTLNMCFQDLP